MPDCATAVETLWNIRVSTASSNSHRRPAADVRLVIHFVNITPGSEVTRQETTTNRCAIKPCSSRAAVCFYSATQGD